MNNVTEGLTRERRQKFVGEGTVLEIVTCEVCKGEWELAVFNEHGVASHWTEHFESSDAAITAALRAIEEEGVEPFQSMEGFDYLLE